MQLGEEGGAVLALKPLRGRVLTLNSLLMLSRWFIKRFTYALDEGGNPPTTTPIPLCFSLRARNG